MVRTIYRRGVETGEHTGQHKQNDPVNNQHGPEDRDIEDGEPGADEADSNGLSG
jgi:hypothetical protein